MKKARQQGFTLIEISIVLVVIGLIVGGVLVGQSLISAAGVRATVTQIEKYNQAVNTFWGKTGYLPGDINATAAAQFGFAARGSYPGEGDGNGLLEGNATGTVSSSPANGLDQGTGETAMFWVDLSAANLIEGSFNTASSFVPPSGDVPATSVSLYFPQAKIGQGSFVYVYSSNGSNYYGVLAVTGIRGPGGGGGGLYSGGTGNFGLTVQQAYAIDSKIDDGLPQSGNVTAQFVSGSPNVGWAGPNSPYFSGPPYTNAQAGSSITCFDNGNVGGATQQYSVEQNGGAGVNCALSFKMQAGDR